jgi:hypothetical protein
MVQATTASLASEDADGYYSIAAGELVVQQKL